MTRCEADDLLSASVVKRAVAGVLHQKNYNKYGGVFCNVSWLHSTPDGFSANDYFCPGFVSPSTFHGFHFIRKVLFAELAY